MAELKRCTVGRENHALGYFNSAKLAAHAYDNFVRSNFAEGAYLNFPNEYVAVTRIDGRTTIKGKVKYKGVTESGKKFKATARIEKRNVYLGTFLSAGDAARACDTAIFNAYGATARLNFPEDYGL